MSIISRIFKKKYTREDPRVMIQNFHEIKFFFNGEEFEVYNISVAGIGFLTVEKISYRKGDKIKALVQILDKQCDIEVEVRQQTKKLVGCKVVGSAEIYEKFIKEYFISELKALNLKLIAKEKLAADENGEPYWLYGGYNHEIYYTVDPNDVINTMQINYHGYMFIKSGGNITTGIADEEQKENISHKGTRLVKDSNLLPKDIMEFMFRFVESAQELPTKHKKQILKVMRKKFNYDWQV